MTTNTHRRSGVLLVVAGLGALSGCFSSTDTADAGTTDGGGSAQNDSGGGGGGGGGDSGVGGGGNDAARGHAIVPLTATDTGYVDGTNAFGILGAWYAYGDSWGASGGPPGKCQEANHSDAEWSSITFPPAAAAGDAGGAGFPQTTPGEFCLEGTAAKAIGAPPDYSNIFGIGIGLDFNNAGGVKKAYDAKSNGIVGFQFKLSGVPAAPGTVRVELTMPATDATGDAYSKTITADGVYTVLFTDLKPSFTLPAGTSEPAFDASAIESIQVHLPTVTTASIPATKVCVSNFSVVTQ